MFAPLVLFVDRNASNVQILSTFLHDSGYRTGTATTIQDFDALLADERRLADVSLAMVDLQGFGAEIWERCRALHEAGVAFVVIARRDSQAAHLEMRRQSHGAGARHTLTKPLRKEQLLTLVRILTETEPAR